MVESGWREMLLPFFHNILLILFTLFHLNWILFEEQVCYCSTGKVRDVNRALRRHQCCCNLYYCFWKHNIRPILHFKMRHFPIYSINFWENGYIPHDHQCCVRRTYMHSFVQSNPCWDKTEGEKGSSFFISFGPGFSHLPSLIRSSLISDTLTTYTK